jgi:23S rRNA (guanine745-N1)-methyltransferase
LVCTERHSFDIARQGYVNLTHGRARHRGDTAAMVAAREWFLSHGHYQPLVETVRVLAAEHDPISPGTALDLAGGTGHYLASVLEALPERHGICLDASVPALKRAARAHPRAAAIGADVWQRWPLATNSTSTVINIFAPRNTAETRRVLSPAGILIIARPTPDHLRELIGPLQMPTIDPHKPDRLAATLTEFSGLDSQLVTCRLGVNHGEVQALAGMGPAARHATTEDTRQRITQLPKLVSVTVSVEVSVYRQSDH